MAASQLPLSKEKKPGASKGHTVLARLSKCLPRTQINKVSLTSETRRGCAMDDTRSFSPGVPFAKKDCKLPATAGRTAVVSIPVNSVPDTDAEPVLI